MNRLAESQRPLFRRAPSRGTPKTYSETEFAFLQRADTPFWSRVRDVIERWFVAFPTNRRDHIEKRLRSDDPRQFYAGMWELYIYHVLKGGGMRVDVLEEGSTPTPDFEVHARASSFYVEATMVSVIKETAIRAERRRAKLLDALDELKSDKFVLDVYVAADGPELPATNRLKVEVVRRLEELNSLAAAMAPGTLLADHGWVWVRSGWEVHLTPILLPQERWGQHSYRMVGGLSSGDPYEVRDDVPLRTRLLAKIEHYEGRFQPLLIATHLDNPFASRRELAALFGWPMELTPDREVERSTFEKERGVFFTRRGRDLGGVALITELRPWTMARAQAHLWVNPNAAAPLPAFDIWPTHDFRMPMGPSRLLSAGQEPGLLLDLPADWPGPEEPFEAAH